MSPRSCAAALLAASIVTSGYQRGYAQSASLSLQQLDAVAHQTASQRQDVAEAIQAEIDSLQMRLRKILLKKPRTSGVQKEINLINDALSAKLEALEQVRGRASPTSPAAAESFAAATNPYYLICRDQLWTPSSDPLRWFPDYISKVTPHLVAVGRGVGEILSGDNVVGTGIAVGKGLVVTNLHVLQDLAADTGGGNWTFAKPATILFDKEYALGRANKCELPHNQRKYRVTGVYYVAENGNDLAVVSTSTDADYPARVVFTHRELRAYRGNMKIVVIGYPQSPRDMTLLEQDRYFRLPDTSTARFGLKRLSPGRVGLYDPTPEGVFFHQANTTQGNSGSAIVDLADGAVIGMHAKGHDRFQTAMGYNEAIISDRVNANLRMANILGDPQPLDADAQRKCLEGEWAELESETTRWIFDLDGNALQISRMDGFVAGKLVRNGPEWRGGVRWRDGRAWTDVVLVPDENCSIVRTNQRWAYKRPSPSGPVLPAGGAILPGSTVSTDSWRGRVCCAVRDALGRRLMLSVTLGEAKVGSSVFLEDLGGPVPAKRSVGRVLLSEGVFGLIELDNDEVVSNSFGGASLRLATSTPQLGSTLRMLRASRRGVDPTSGYLEGVSQTLQLEGLGAFQNLLLVRTDSRPDDTGAPIITDESELVGVVFSGEPNSTLILPVGKFLQEHSLTLL